MNTKRMEELLNSMKSFSKSTYLKKDLLDEMLLLQSEVVNLTFDEIHASGANLRLWDVVRHFEQLNEQCGHVADEELEKFRNDCKELGSLIKGQILGNRGEYKAFGRLENLCLPNIVLKNVEMGDISNHTEIDAVVITPKCLTIVEVKNTSKNVFIDEDGNYYRMGEYQSFDCNIREKMELREVFLKDALRDGGIENLKIRKIVVFTNNKIEIQNKCSKDIKTCFLSQLPYMIEGTYADDIYTKEDMDNIKNIIEANESQSSYLPDFNVNNFKVDFAKLVVVLEETANAREEEQVVQTEETSHTEQITKEPVPRKAVINKKDIYRYAGMAAAVILYMVSTAVAVNKANKGGF